MNAVLDRNGLMDKTDPKTIIVVGRGNSGTRILSRLLTTSDVYMGSVLNQSGDLLPADDLYKACILFSRHCRWLGGASWDFSNALDADPTDAFRAYLARFLQKWTLEDARLKGWKLPETTLVYPWIVKLYPDAYYIYVVRDPLDSLLGSHITDRLDMFGVDAPKTENAYIARAVSWKYQFDLVGSTPSPVHFHRVRYEDLVTEPDAVVRHLEEFLGERLSRPITHTRSIGRHKDVELPYDYLGFLEPARQQLGYASVRCLEREQGKGLAGQQRL